MMSKGGTKGGPAPSIAAQASVGTGLRTVREARRPSVPTQVPVAARAALGKTLPRASIARLPVGAAAGTASATATAAAAAAAATAAELRARRETAKRVKQLLIRHVELADALLDEGECERARWACDEERAWRRARMG